MSENSQVARMKHRSKSLWPWVRPNFLDMTPKSQSIKEKVEKLDSYHN